MHASSAILWVCAQHCFMTSKSLTGQMLSGDSLPGVHPFQLPCPEPSPAWHKAGREKRNWRATLSLGLRHCPQPGGFSLLIGGSGSGLPVPSSIGALPPLHPLLSSSLLSPLLLTRCQHLAGSFRLRLSSFVVVIPSACSSILPAAPLHLQGIQTTEHSTPQVMQAFQSRVMLVKYVQHRNPKKALFALRFAPPLRPAVTTRKVKLPTWLGPGADPPEPYRTS